MASQGLGSSNVPCDAHQALPERNDVSIPGVAWEVHRVPPSARLIDVRGRMCKWLGVFGLTVICKLDDWAFDLISNSCLFVVIVFEIVIALWKLEHDFSVVSHESRRPGLQEKRTDPNILPVNEARDPIVLHEDIWCVYIPVPQGWPS